MTQYFVAASLAVTIASSLFEFGVTSMAHLFFFLAVSLILLSSQVHGHFQISRDVLSSLSMVSSGVTQGHSACYHGCLVRVIILVKDEPLPQSNIQSRSRLLSKMSLYIAAFIFPSTLTSLPIPAAKIHPHSMMLPPPCFTVGMVLARC